VNRSSLTALLTARWLLLHLLFVAAVVATGFLAWWQWDRAHEAGGSFQNLGYALQWPMFGAFTLFLWYRVARMHLHETFASEGTDAQSSDAQSSNTRSSDARSPDARAADGAGRAPAGSIEPGALGRSNRRLVPPPAERVDSAEDPQMAEYNRYLAELNSADETSADETSADETSADERSGERTRSS
jgi:hypothetical protein